MSRNSLILLIIVFHVHCFDLHSYKRELVCGIERRPAGVRLKEGGREVRREIELRKEVEGFRRWCGRGEKGEQKSG